jgi:hypothetical protein
MSRLPLRFFIEAAKLDWSEMYFETDTGTALSHDFPLGPGDFLAFARADFALENAHDFVNALSNAKRAVDCQTDIFISANGLDPQNLSKQLGKSSMAGSSQDLQRQGITLKFRLLAELGVATPSIVARMRKLRNDLEHDYRRPRRNEVSDAIDVAELFVQACGGKMKSVIEAFSFGSGISTARGDKRVARNIYLRFDPSPRAHFSISFWDTELIAKEGATKSPCIKVQAGDDEFYPLLKLMWHTDWDKDMTKCVSGFLSELGISFPRSKFRVHAWRYD